MWIEGVLHGQLCSLCMGTYSLCYDVTLSIHSLCALFYGALLHPLYILHGCMSQWHVYKDSYCTWHAMSQVSEGRFQTKCCEWSERGWNKHTRTFYLIIILRSLEGIAVELLYIVPSWKSRVHRQICVSIIPLHIVYPLLCMGYNSFLTIYIQGNYMRLPAE